MTAARFPDAVARPTARLLDWIDRHAGWCSLGGLGILALLSWYVEWHVPHSSWLFSSQYAQPFKDLTYRIDNVRSVEHLGILYYKDINKLQYFVYPPAALWMFWPLTWVSLALGEFLWTLTSLLALALLIAAAARNACHWRWAKCWAVSLLVATPLSAIVLVPVDVHLALGQVGLYLAALATVDILCIRTKRFRGVLTGITAALKIYPIVYFFIFFAKREWRALGNAIGSLLAVTGVAWAVFPRYTATFFVHRLLSGGELRHYWHNAHWISSSSSLYTFFFRQPFNGASHAWERDAGLLCCVVVIALGLFATWRQLREGREVAALLCIALASTIGSPVAWDHYFFWIVLAPFVLVERERLPGWRSAALVCYGIASLVPLRLGRNEDLSHRAYDLTFLVIFTARNAFIVVSLFWLVVAAIPAARLYRSRSDATTSSDQARSGPLSASGVRP